MTTQIRPLNDKLVIKRLEAEDKTKGGILLPDSAKEKPIQGQVVAVGTGRRLKDGSTRPLDLQQGQKVLFEKWAGSEVKLEGEEHLILREDEVLGTLD